MSMRFSLDQLERANRKGKRGVVAEGIARSQKFNTDAHIPRVPVDLSTDPATTTGNDNDYVADYELETEDTVPLPDPVDDGPDESDPEESDPEDTAANSPTVMEAPNSVRQVEIAEKVANSAPPTLVKKVSLPVTPRLVPAQRPVSRPMPRPVPPVQPQSDDTAIPGVISIVLDAPVRARYAASKRPDQTLRAYLVERLVRCQHHTAEKPIYINDRIRREMERISNRNFDNAEELLGWMMMTLSAIHWEDIPLRIEPELIERAENRRPPEQTIGECLSEYLTAGIEIKTGMR